MHAPNHSATDEAADNAVEVVEAVQKVSGVIDWTAALRWFSGAAVSIALIVFFVCLIGWMIKINFSGLPEYRKFRLAHMFMRQDGTLDRRGLKDTVLFAASILGYFYVLVRHPDMIINYFWVLSVVWLGSHLADKKFPSAEPKLPSTPEELKAASEEPKP